MDRVKPGGTETPAPTPRDGETLDAVARIYHTDGPVVHLEGETYTVADRWMAETLYGIGFVTIQGWTPPPDPPALDWKWTTPPGRGRR